MNLLIIMGNAREHFRRFFSDQIPLWVKLIYTLWVAILVIDHWQSSPISLLWFCNVALLTTLVALWLENSLLASMQAVAIIWWLLLWILDFLIHLATGVKTVGMPLGMSNYMFDTKFSIFSRCLSLYHAWLPFVLIWLIWRLGYDRRALLAQTAYGWVVVLLSYALTQDPTGPAGNVNQVYGLSESKAQSWMAPWQWLALMMGYLLLCCYLPSHFVFHKIFSPPKAEPSIMH